jgi:hypothetical protein
MRRQHAKENPKIAKQTWRVSFNILASFPHYHQTLPSHIFGLLRNLTWNLKNLSSNACTTDSIVGIEVRLQDFHGDASKNDSMPPSVRLAADNSFHLEDQKHALWMDGLPPKRWVLPTMPWHSAKSDRRRAFKWAQPRRCLTSVTPPKLCSAWAWHESTDVESNWSL